MRRRRLWLIGTVVLCGGATFCFGQATASVNGPERASVVTSAWDRLRGVLGAVLILAVAVALSENRRAISRRVVLWGLGLQWLFALLVLRLPQGKDALSATGKFVEGVLGC